jgi:hypothetical protein
MALRPTFVVEPEMRYAQLGEPFAFAARLVDARTLMPVTPSSATVTVTDGVGGALDPAVSGESMSVAGEEITYSLAAASLPSEPERAYRMLVSAVVGSDTWTFIHLFDCVDFSPRQAADYAQVGQGVPGVERLAPPEDPDHSQIIREAWDDVLTWLRSLSVYPDLALDQQQLAKGHTYRARHLIYARVARDPQDAYAFQADRWAQEYRSWQESVKLLVDADASGGIEGPELAGKSATVVHFGRTEA